MRNRVGRAALAALGIAFLMQGAASAGAVRPGMFGGSTLYRNDDGYVGPVGIGFTTNFFGSVHNQLWVNTNGNVTFNGGLGTYTPFDLTTTGMEIIAPFFADVDTRYAGSQITYGNGTVSGRNAFGVNWLNVDYYYSSSNHWRRNYFQLVLIDRSDVGPGDFDIEFNYDQIQWETGDASGGSGGLGGYSARAGFSNGTRNPGTFFELPGSAVHGAFLDGGPNALKSHSIGSPVLGRYLFAARNGQVTPHEDIIPEPGTLALLGFGLVALRRRRR